MDSLTLACSYAHPLALLTWKGRQQGRGSPQKPTWDIRLLLWLLVKFLAALKSMWLRSPKEAFATATLPNSLMSSSTLYMSQSLGNAQGVPGSLTAESLNLQPAHHSICVCRTGALTNLLQHCNGACQDVRSSDGSGAAYSVDT